ncbi:MAG: peptide ABC transporter permease [Rhodospirillales bacterium 70-18]|nr:ABC transporter permease [Rhodospirillales bacterium]OJY73518.1 MAG: peptide ABC transporter permease [Rhodospirillales bacterium 70-18]
MRLPLLALGLLLFCALAAPLLAPGDPLAGSADALLAPLSPGHPLGTDDLGRDLLALLIHGSRVSLAVGLASSVCSLAIGVLAGAVAGWLGGWADAAVMRVAEFFQTLPRFVLALIVIALAGPGIGKVIAVIAVLAWPQTARVVRAEIAALRGAAFVDAARLGGMPGPAIVLREVLPQVAGPVLVLAALDVATAILLEAGLGFFGLGDPNLASWGAMLNEAQQYLRSAWWMSVFPGLAIGATVLVFNALGDAAAASLDPRGR